MLSAFGVHLHQIWLLWLGSGVLGGIGLGLGYISPVSTMYILAGLLMSGFLCNLLVRPVAEKHYMSDEDIEQERRLAHEVDNGGSVETNAAVLSWRPNPASGPLLVICWTLVGIPLLWAIWRTLKNAASLFV